MVLKGGVTLSSHHAFGGLDVFMVRVCVNKDGAQTFSCDKYYFHAVIKSFSEDVR